MSVRLHELGKLFRDCEAEWLLVKLRQRIESGRGLDGRLRLQIGHPSQRDGMDRLFGRRPTQGRHLTINLADLEAILREAGLAGSLLEAIEALTGPVMNQADLRKHAQADWERVFEMGSRLIDGRADLQDWLSALNSTGLLRRLSRQDPRYGHVLLTKAVAALSRLPANGVPLAELAALVTGDAHALDADSALSTLVLRALPVDSGVAIMEGAERRRALWATAGVVADELSSTVLVLNLRTRPDPNSLLDLVLAEHAKRGEPCRLTLRQLLRYPPAFSVSDTGDTVFICENPTVVAAAASRLSSKSRPLICIEGQPKTPAHLLLRALRASRLKIAYHGDFDWPGLRIARSLIDAYEAAPWRLFSSDYEKAIARGTAKLVGSPVATPWDPRLHELLKEKRIAVHEESVLDELCTDLIEDR